MVPPATTLSDDLEVPEEDETKQTEDVEYSFEGFSLEFSERVVLMPAGTP